MPGPAPKRAAQRRRTNSVSPDTVAMPDGIVPIPDLDLQDVHPLAASLYESLKVSGQAQYYEPSDWQRARLVCELLSRQLKAGRMSSTMYQAIQNDLTALMTCEADRRKLRMEIERTDSSVDVDDPRVALMESYGNGNQPS